MTQAGWLQTTQQRPCHLVGHRVWCPGLPWPTARQQACWASQPGMQPSEALRKHTMREGERLLAQQRLCHVLFDGEVYLGPQHHNFG